MNRITPITMLFAAAMFAAAPAQAQAQRDRNRSRDREFTRIDSTFAFEKGGAVNVELLSGEIIISGWTRPEAKVYATIEHGWIDAQLSSHRITLGTSSDRGRSGTARYEISVPVGTRVQASSVSGSIRITGTDGEVEADAVNGAVEVIGATDRITVQTVNGRLHASKLRGRVRLGNTNSSIEADDIVGELSASSVSGNVSLTGIQSSHVTAETVSGYVTFAGSIDPAGNYEFSTHSGRVQIAIPDLSSATLLLETFNGRISSAFPITLQPGEISGMARHGKKMEFTIGKGGARITASTFSGNIIIDKGGHTSREEN
jgi:hypothetical protein